VPIDTNIERVVARLHALSDKAEIRSAAEAMAPATRAGDFAQAMMDLGATICRPRQPECQRCPFAEECRARQLGSPEAFPAKRAKKTRPLRHGIAYWTERDGAVWLVRRPSRGMLGGMVALPGPEWGDSPVEAAAIARVRHVFTHFALDLAILPAAEPQGEGRWHPVNLLADAGLPTLYRRAAEAVLAQRVDLAA
jgi:A/G-specific adenine glycosylase